MKTISGRWLMLLMVALSAGLSGCAASEVDTQGPALPHRLEITMHTRTSDNRITYFVLHPRGSLDFAGGAQAATREALPAGRINAQQQERLIRIIQTHQLLQAKGAFMFARGDKSTCDLSLTLDDQSNSLRALDDQVPGIKALHDELMSLQAEMRYRTVPAMSK